MADTLDLLLQGTGDGESLQASLASAGGLHSFALVPPQGLQRAYQAWRDRFLAHHNGTAVSAEAVQHYAAQLLRLLAGWLQDGSFDAGIEACGGIEIHINDLVQKPGAAAGHGVATAIAVSVGDILNKSDLVSEKVIKYTGGALFILFAILTALEIQ